MESPRKEGASLSDCETGILHYHDPNTMSITTKRGDGGTTDLLFGKRVPKNDARMDAIGAVDELNAIMGVVRVHSNRARLDEWTNEFQERLTGLMGELAVIPEDVLKYVEKGFPMISEEDVAALEEKIKQLEAEVPPATDWVRPGAAGHQTAAYLDLARTICRRAERRILDLGDGVPNQQVRLFMNRASDFLWLLARELELGIGSIGGN
jgi:cob(I)alamin adenosyltransferase